jgi:hypothetical protein
LIYVSQIIIVESYNGLDIDPIKLHNQSAECKYCSQRSTQIAATVLVQTVFDMGWDTEGYSSSWGNERESNTWDSGKVRFFYRTKIIKFDSREV